MDDLALFGDLDPGIRRGRRLSQDRLVRRAAAAANRSTAPVEDPQPPSVPRDDRGDGSVRAVERPGRGKIPDFFVAVRVAEHHFLDPAPSVELAGIDRIAQQAVDDRGGAFQRVGGLEERHDIEFAPRRVGREVVKARQAGKEEGLHDVVAAFGHAQDEGLG
jgi:hypothetical protein